MASVPSAASTASARPSHTTAAWPTSSAPRACTIRKACCDVGAVFGVRREPAQRAFCGHQAWRGLGHADRLQARILADADNEAQQRVIALLGRRDRLGQQQHALGVQLHLVEFGPVHPPAQQHFVDARGLQRLDDAARLARRQEFVREILDPVFGDAAHQRHHKDVAARRARRLRHRARQLAAARDQAQSVLTRVVPAPARQAQFLFGVGQDEIHDLGHFRHAGEIAPSRRGRGRPCEPPLP